MKILMLGWELPPHNSGGLGVACYNLSKALALEGAIIDFVVPYKAEHPGIDFMTVHCATDLSPVDRYKLGAYDIYSNKENGFLNNMCVVQQHYAKFVEKLVTKIKPDVIHCHDWMTMQAGVRASKMTGCPLVVHVHATEFDRSGRSYGNELIHEIEKDSLTMADRIIAVSNITKSLIIKNYDIPASKIETLHNAVDVNDLGDDYGYDTETYKYLEELKKEGYTIVSTVTRLTIQKGLFHFIRAAARACEKYNKLVFLLAGDGEQRDELVQLAADLGVADKIFFTGFVRGKQWRDAFSVSDVFVMSSVSEPFGLTALEAAFFGNALIITKQSGVSEVLNNIFSYDFWREDILADKMIGLATSSVLRHSLQQNIQKEYAKISWSDVAKSCCKIYGIANGELVR